MNLPAPETSGMPSRAEITASVDRYMAQHKPTAQQPLPAAKVEPPAPPAPAITVVDFVCEDDVRRAVREERKIYIGPRAIVTPSARDYANQHDVLVLTHVANQGGPSKKAAATE